MLEANPTARICVVRSIGGIGDILMTTPALYTLKYRFPDCHLTYAIDWSDLGIYHILHNAPFIDELIDYRVLDHSAYDVVVDLTTVCVAYEQTQQRPINRIDLFAWALGVELSYRIPFYRMHSWELEAAEARFENARLMGKKIVIVHTAADDEDRTWPLDRLLELVAACENEWIVFGILNANQPFDWELYPNVIDLSGTNVREMAAYIAVADLFVGSDSGPMHLAGALKVPSIVMFGPVPPEARINHYPSHSELSYEESGCLGCLFIECPDHCGWINNIPADSVYSAIMAFEDTCEKKPSPFSLSNLWDRCRNYSQSVKES